MSPEECEYEYELSRMNWPAHYADRGDYSGCAGALHDGDTCRKTELCLTDADARLVDEHLRARGLTLVDDGSGWWEVTRAHA